MKVQFKQKALDYPKKSGDLNLAWYAGGRICIVRKKTERALQKQNLSIIQINAITKAVWETLNPSFKQDLARYAVRYKKEYPTLRKRGVSAYAVFLILIHALIKRFSLNTDNDLQCIKTLITILANLSIYQAIRLKLLKRVRACYQLNNINTEKPINLFSSFYSSENDSQKRNSIRTPITSGYG